MIPMSVPFAMRAGVIGLLFVGLVAGRARAEDPVPLARGVRGLVTLARTKVVLDGSLREWSNAFCTPVQYNHRDVENRAAQFYYMWDDEALFIALRCLDERQANLAPLASTQDGDAVEFYLDTRPGDALRSKDWTTGAIHLFFSAFQGEEVRPRWVMRQGIATSKTVLTGVEIGAAHDADSYQVEFKLPWSNFPGFTPRLGAVLALDAELCSGDGGKRTDRSFAYGSPLSVQQPASLGKVELVRVFDPDYLPAVGPAAFPFWVETPWNQPERAHVQAVVAIPPAFAEIVGEVEVRIHNADGKIIKTIPARIEPFGPPAKGFLRAGAFWSIDDYAPNTYFATARIIARTEKTLTTVAPRMVHEANMTGR
jgi:hypothetical protein